jgi:hypothetical protein
VLSISMRFDRAGRHLHITQLGVDLRAIRIHDYRDLGSGWDQFVQETQTFAGRREFPSDRTQAPILE